MRSRKIIIEPYVTLDSRWPVLKLKINKLLSKVRNGEDLTPFLSLRAHQKGYMPINRIRSGDANIGDDQDFFLNTMGFHHFHLDERILPSGMSERTKDVLFARLTRDEFHAVAIFNHSVFEPERDGNNEMNEERKRLWQIFYEFSSRGLAPETVRVPSMKTTSGHPLYIRFISGEYTHVLNEIDHRLTDREYENGIYNEAKLTKPKNNKLAWHINGLDLGLIDKENNFFIFRYGPA